MISQAIGGTPSGPGRAADTPWRTATQDPILSGLAALACTICETPWASFEIIGHGEVWCLPAAERPAFAGQRPGPFAHHTALRSAGGEALGTLAVYDARERSLSDVQLASLNLLAAQAVAAIELRSQLTELALLSAGRPAGSTPTLDAGSDRALLESAPVAIYHTDAAGNMAYSNPEYRRIFGLQPGHSPDAWAERLHPDDRLRMESAWADFCLKPVASRFGYRTQADDGTMRHLSELVVAVEGVPGWVGTISDFTELVTARDSLRKTETMFRNTFDQAPIGIAYADRGGKIMRCNHAFWTLLGFDPGDLAGRTMNDVTHRDDVARVSAELERLWGGDIEFVDLEKRYTRKDGSVVWVRMTTALVREGDAAPEYSVEFLRDITARKDSAEELERVHKQLMIASRQAGMAEVATNVLHNVGNILNSVNISASLVIERVKQSKAPGVSRLAALLREKGAAAGEFLAKDERGRRIPEYLTSLGEQLMGDQKMALEELASLRDNLEHIKDTVAMQQSYAKLCGVTETVEVADLVEDSLRLNAGAFVRHGVTLHREFNEVPPITVDKHKVLQILVNLVRNAKYACDESGRSDKLITLRIETAPAGVRICVVDNGVGIPAENMARLFTHGFTTRVDGHGFGLHSGALAAQELGGSLSVISDGRGRGATFTLELPCNPVEAAHA
jgi:PAS domain S-box-containing protein